MDGRGRAAELYSLTGTARLDGLHLEDFLREVLTRVADHPVDRTQRLLPWRLGVNGAEESIHATGESAPEAE